MGPQGSAEWILGLRPAIRGSVGDGLLQGFGGGTNGICKQANVVGPSHTLGGEEILIVRKRSRLLMDGLVEDHPCLATGLSEHGDGVLGVPGGFVSEALTLLVD